MFHVRQENLPFVGSSHEFVGAEQGNTGVSVFLFQGKPGSGPGPHRHPYDEIQFIREGRGVWTVSGKTFEGAAGDIFVIKAGEIHSFKAVGDSPLVQLDIHLRRIHPRESIEQWGPPDGRGRYRNTERPLIPPVLSMLDLYRLRLGN